MSDVNCPSSVGMVPESLFQSAYLPRRSEERKGMKMKEGKGKEKKGSPYKTLNALRSPSCVGMDPESWFVEKSL